MNEDETKIQRAADILKSHRVGEIAEDLLNHSYRLKSMPALTCTHCTKLSCVDNDVSGVILTLAVGDAQFPGSGICRIPIQCPKSSGRSRQPATT
jgi:hypothetical protein